jgi:hypothetical protein
VFETETDLVAAADLTTPREKAVEKAEALRGAATAKAVARMAAENFMVAVNEEVVVR